MNLAISRSRHVCRRSSALVATLIVMALITIIAMAYLSSVLVESKISESNLEQQRAYAMAMMGANSGMGVLRDALGPWDSAYSNFATNPPPYFWSVSPGMLTRWSYSNTAPLTNIALFSDSSDTNEASPTVNLNRAQSDGTYPILEYGSTNAINIKWTEVTQNPSAPASASNRIIGRYAFWIDDESAKINLNVADGTSKYTTNSLGVGSPTEVSLQALTQEGTNISLSTAQNLVQYARTNAFLTPREVLHIDADPSIYANNVSSLTTYSRSPDLNIFGQPKMAILPVLGGPAQTNMVINGITLQPETEIYPTPSQLARYRVLNPYPGGGTYNCSWPLAFRSEQTMYTTGRAAELCDGSWLYGTDNYCYNNGRMIANYLAGTNAAGKPISWPPFPGSTAAGFAGKYSPRQLDSIAVQVVSLGSKMISSDYPYAAPGDYPASYRADGGASYPSAYYTYGYGDRFLQCPYIFPGWLSHQWVTGMAAGPKVSRVFLRFTTMAAKSPVSVPPLPPSAYTPPELYVDIWVEWWFPGSYRAGNNVLSYPHNGVATYGVSHQSSLNVADAGRSGSGFVAASIPKTANGTGSNGNLSYWENQVLTNDAGGDFNANPSTNYYWTSNTYASTNDPDQSEAVPYHTWTGTSSTGATPPILGAGTVVTSVTYPSAGIMKMPSLERPMADALRGWAPGEMHLTANSYGSGSYLSAPNPLKLSPTVGGTTIHIGGGIQVRSEVRGGWWSDPDPTPLECIRGRDNPDITATAVSGGEITTDDAWLDPWTSTLGMNGGTVTVRDRNVQSAIPINVAIAVPADDYTGPGNVMYAYATNADPLVNKFPGDWQVTVSSTPPSTTLPWSTTVNNTMKNYCEADVGFRTSLQDSDSYWVPQMDGALTPKTNIASQTLIPRSARMPSVGYLQYVRTGIIPDDETVTYSQQHGTPFRLLSFAPSGDIAQTVTGAAGHGGNYPDWAMLDLFYVPTLLNSYGGPWASATNLAPFGTSGGATSGRINPNGCVVYTDAASVHQNPPVPQANFARLTPLRAALYGLKVNQTFSTTFTKTPPAHSSDANGFPESPYYLEDYSTAWPYTGGTAVDVSGDAGEVASAIANYIRSNGPLRVPAEIADVPAVSALKAGVNPTGTRNDLVRQVVGTLTTQSNVFSVWAAGQVVKKIPGNLNYGSFEAGDVVLAEVRLHFVVERYLDPGADGVYGNSVSPGPDGLVNTWDDPVNATNHPFQPKYLYRVIRSEEIH